MSITKKITLSGVIALLYAGSTLCITQQEAPQLMTQFDQFLMTATLQSFKQAEGILNQFKESRLYQGTALVTNMELKLLEARMTQTTRAGITSKAGHFLAAFTDITHQFFFFNPLGTPEMSCFTKKGLYTIKDKEQYFAKYKTGTFSFVDYSTDKDKSNENYQCIPKYAIHGIQGTTFGWWSKPQLINIQINKISTDPNAYFSILYNSTKKNYAVAINEGFVNVVNQALSSKIGTPNATTLTAMAEDASNYADLGGSNGGGSGDTDAPVVEPAPASAPAPTTEDATPAIPIESLDTDVTKHGLASFGGGA